MPPVSRLPVLVTLLFLAGSPAQASAPSRQQAGPTSREGRWRQAMRRLVALDRSPHDAPRLTATVQGLARGLGRRHRARTLRALVRKRLEFVAWDELDYIRREVRELAGLIRPDHPELQRLQRAEIDALRAVSRATLEESKAIAPTTRDEELRRDALYDDSRELEFRALRLSRESGLWRWPTPAAQRQTSVGTGPL